MVIVTYVERNANQAAGPTTSQTTGLADYVGMRRFGVFQMQSKIQRRWEEVKL